MAMLIINYDLHKERNYKRIEDGIKKASGGNWIKLLATTWVITSQKTPEEMRDILIAYIDEDDSLLVMETTNKTWGSWNLDIIQSPTLP